MVLPFCPKTYFFVGLGDACRKPAKRRWRGPLLVTFMADDLVSCMPLWTSLAVPLCILFLFVILLVCTS